MNNPSVLIVEDDGLIALNLMQFLQRSGFDVLEPVATGEEGIECVASSPPRIILMDIRLAGKINGIETARQIRTNFDIPIIFLTAHSEPDFQATAEEISPYGFFVKPIDEEDVLSAIRNALGKKIR